MALTEIDLSKNAKDATLTPAKISTNPADNFAFPNNVVVDGSSITLPNNPAGSIATISTTNASTKLNIASARTVFVTAPSVTLSPAFAPNAVSLGSSGLFLYDDAARPAVTWDTVNGRKLYDINSNPMLDWINGQVNILTQLSVPLILDPSNNNAIDVTNRYLKDTSNAIALDWLNRLLYASDGSTQNINFSVPGTVDINAILDATGHSIIHVADPVSPTDAANKTYVDTVAQGLLTKAACTAATVAALPAVTPAGSGVGKTLTENANGLLTVDGVSTWVDVVNDGGSTNPAASNPASRVLVKNQANPIDNGIYCVTNKGSAGAPFVLTRAIDFDGSPANEVAPGDFTFIGEGTVNASSGWTVSGTNNPVVVDTDPIPFIQFSGAGQIIAGQGLTKTGNELDVHPLDASLLTHVGDISVQRDPAGAVGLSGAGVKVNVDGTYIGISANTVTLLNPTQHTIAGADKQIQYNNTGSFGASANLVWDYSTNRLGINNSSPSVELDLGGSARISGTLEVDGAQISLPTNGSSSISLGCAGVAGTIIQETGVGGEVTFQLFDPNAGQPFFRWGNVFHNSRFSTGLVVGNIGIDTSETLVVYGGAKLTATTPTNGGNLTLTGTGASNGKITAGGNMAIDGTTFNVDAVGHKVGVGTSSPAQLLDVGAGNIRVGNSNTYTNGFGLRTAGIYDYNGGQAIDLQDKYLLGANTFTVAWSAELLAHNNGGWSVKWGDNNVGGVTTRILIDPNATAAVDWTNRLLGDNTGTNGNYNIGSGAGQAKLSLDWSNRNLVASDGSTVNLNWTTPGTLQLESATIITANGSNTLTLTTAFNTNTGDSAALTVQPGGIGTGLFSAGDLTLAGGNGVGGGQPASLILSGWKGNDHSLSPSNATLNCGGGDGTSPGSFIIKSGGSETARFTNSHTFAVGTPTPNASALVDLTSTTLGVLLPRMTTVQKNAIVSPATGLIVYDTTLNFLQEWNGTAWTGVSAASNTYYSNLYLNSSVVNADLNAAANILPAKIAPGTTGQVIGVSSGSNTWANTTGNPSSAHSGNLGTQGGATLTVLQSGLILVAGGNASFNPVSVAELYSTSTKTWSSAGNMTSVRAGQTATLLPNGKVLVAGGWGPSGFPAVASAELYDPVANTWTATGSMAFSRSEHLAFYIPSINKVLIVGGFTDSAGNVPTATCELYDPVAGTFSSTGSMSIPRRIFSGQLLSTGKVLAICGYTTGNSRVNTCELYDPVLGTWSATGSTSVIRGDFVSVLLSNGKVVIAGGGDAGTTSELYDPSLGTWSTTGSIPATVTGTTAILLPTGNVLLSGGFSAGNYQSACAQYTPSTGVWAATGSMSVPRAGHVLVLANDGTALAVGGQTTGNADAISSEYFTTLTAAWVPALSPNLTSAHIYVGNGSNVATDTAMTGDVSITNTGVTSIAAGLAAHIVTREVPSGTINGSNTVFTLANTPVAGTECVFLNGLLQNVGVGNDYTISGATITFVTAPDAGSVILVNYIK